MAKRTQRPAMPQPQAGVVNIELHELKLGRMELTIIGDTPLIMHKFSVKAQGQMLADQVKASWPKVAKDPIAQFEGATTYIDEHNNEIACPADLRMIVEGKAVEFIRQFDDWAKTLPKIKNPRYGFPVPALKAAAIRACKGIGLTMTDMRTAFHVPVNFVQIVGERTMRADMVRVGMKKADIRFRPQFTDWHISFPITYNMAIVTPDMLANIFNAAGQGGLGEWRPEKTSGNYGRFHLANADEINLLKRKAAE